MVDNTACFVFTKDGFYQEGKAKTADKFEWLYAFGLEEPLQKCSASAAFLRKAAEYFFRDLTHLPELEVLREKVQVAPSEDSITSLLMCVPFTAGAEYVTEHWIKHLYDRLTAVFQKEISRFSGTAQMYFTEKSQNLHAPERVFFHLVENKNSDFPFLFMATYATAAEDGSVRHYPLQYALTEYKNNREKLLQLLVCLNRAAKISPLLAELIQSGEMLHPLQLTTEEAYEILKNIEAIEQAGILCRIPNWWKKKTVYPMLQMTVGSKKPSLLGFQSILSVQPAITLDGETLSKEDIMDLLARTEGLALLKGKWVEVNHSRLKRLLEAFEQLPTSLTLAEALRMNNTACNRTDDVEITVSNGKWLAETLQTLRRPQAAGRLNVPASLNATLRKYQKDGYTWLCTMQSLGFGACLADDMGLGKTVQVLAFLEKMRTANNNARVLLLVPASLMENWRKEAARFVPKMDVHILYGKTAPLLDADLREHRSFLTVTSYGLAGKIPTLNQLKWDCLILDEAQAIKNPGTKQTKSVKALNAEMRIALTGTPIENDLSNLWSLFDFLNCGLLGNMTEFKKFTKNIEEEPYGYEKLRGIISPFMLRRLKTDKSIIADLPDKNEQADYISLSAKQIVLYKRTVKEMEEKIEQAQGIERKGLVLAVIGKLKQICNHPDQFLGQSTFTPSESGKFEMLKEICETIYEKRERVLVFTQYREITAALADYLSGIFHTKGRVLHGGTPVKTRAKIVEDFQNPDTYIPFVVLSVKAGGTGLNLTNANHVIHFDRWWNPAVENQATDRAFRIGQTKNVMVHKLVCQGTIEEKIDALIHSKKELSENVIGAGEHKWLTELSDSELFSLLRLDI